VFFIKVGRISFDCEEVEAKQILSKLQRTLKEFDVAWTTFERVTNYAQ